MQGARRVDEDDGAPGLESVEHGLQSVVAQVQAVHVGQESHAVGVEFVEGVVNLLEARLNVRQRQGGEEAEAVGAALLEVRRVLVAAAGEVAGVRRVGRVQVGAG